MSLLKQILSPFVEFEDDKKKEPVTEYRPPVKQDSRLPVEEYAEHPLITGSKVPASTPTPVEPPGSRTGSALPEHQQYFERLIDEANKNNPLFQGTDFKEFIDGKMDIDNITDEETRYKTAFNLLKRTGLTKEKLLTTAQEYHNIVGRDLNAFQSAHGQKYQQEVRQREQIIEKKAEELKALSDKMNALKKEISQISQEMTETKDKLNTIKNSFLLAGENKQNEIQIELQKIEKYF